MAKKAKFSKAPPLIKLHLALPFIMELEARGLGCESTLSQFNLSRAQMNDEAVFVSAATMYRMLDALADLGKDPGLAVNIGERLDLGEWPLFADAVRNARTLGDFFVQFIGKTHELASSVEYVLEIKGESAKFCLQRAQDPGFCPAQADGFYVGLFYNIFTTLIGLDWVPEQVSMQVCDPAAIPRNYHKLRVYNCDRLGFRMQFPARWLQKLLVSRPDSEATSLYPPDNVPPVEFVEATAKALLPYIHLPDLSVSLAAQFCGYPQRYLARRLNEQGTSLTRVIAGLRKQVAGRLLRETDLSITEIAMTVGFRDLSGFTRSFKKWTGLSPRDYRKKRRYK